jgi:hypothetical protein
MILIVILRSEGTKGTGLTLRTQAPGLSTHLTRLITGSILSVAEGFRMTFVTFT